MKRRLGRLPLHRKLVALALVVSTISLAVALAGLSAVDAWQYRSRTHADLETLAGIIAENSAAAVTFQDPEAAHETLATVRVREGVTRACVYLVSGELFATYERTAELGCPASPAAARELAVIGATAQVVRNGRVLGSVYVEEDFTGGVGRIAGAAGIAVLMLILAGGLAFLLAERLTRSVSQPIVQLARGARRVAAGEELDLPDLRTAEDEVGELVRAFRAMLASLREANAGLLREIEERRRVEAEREALLERERDANRMKDEFVATVAHELRSPLNPILGWAQILESTTPTPEMIDKAIEVITRNVRTQARVIEDLVDVSRIATGKLHVRREVVDLRTLVEQSVEMARSQDRTRAQRIEIELPSEPCLVSADPDRMRQVIGNLLGNAVKFSPAEAPILLSLRLLSGTCELEVRDHGMGIAPEMLPHVFDRFRQADSSTSRRHGGLGLGLAIVKEVVELHGGRVAVTSDGVGRGSSFRVRLPRLAVAGTEALPEAAVDFDVPRLDGVHVLVVDDNSDALEMLAQALRSTGAIVSTAESGSAALDLWERERSDVLLCDLAMPEMDGFQVIEEIRRRDERAGRRTPAIAVSAHASLEYRRRSLQAGFVEHVTKPYRVPDLIHLVREALRA